MTSSPLRARRCALAGLRNDRTRRLTPTSNRWNITCRLGGRLENSAETKDGACPTGARWFASVRVGHLVEVRVEQLSDGTAVEALNAAVACALRRCAPRAVICADVRSAAPLVGEVARVWAQGMRHSNGAIERSALLLDPSNTIFNLQLERIVECANNKLRRIFRDPEEACAWLGVALTDPERNSLRTFLNLSMISGSGFADTHPAAAGEREVVG